MKLIIPESQLGGFKLISELDFKIIKRLIDLMQSYGVSYSQEKFIEEQYSKFKKEVESDSFNLLIETIFSLSTIFNSYYATNEIIAEELVQGYFQRVGLESLPAKRSLEKKIVYCLQGIDYIKLIVKAHSLFQSSSNNYRKSRIINDLRFVFKDNVKSKEKYGVILTTLKITVSNGEYENKDDLYISLDREDLLDLKEQIDRSLDKIDEIQESSMVEILLS